jgi:hypothetical protein
MNSNLRHVNFAVMLALAVAVARPAPGWAGNLSYEQMAPISRYLMADRQAEIELARSAAPSAISIHATFLVLGRHGYETAEKGSNGFTCLVERAWMSPFDSHSSGIGKCAGRFATTRRRRAAFCSTRSGGRKWRCSV